MPRSDKHLQRINLGFGGVLVLLLALVAFAGTSFSSLARAVELNIDMYRVLDATQDVRVAAVNIQTGFRGFVLTGDPEFLEPFDVGRIQFEAGLGALLSLTSHNPTQQRRLGQAEGIYEQWLREHIEPGIAIRRQIVDQDVDIADLVELVNPVRGKMFLDRLEETLVAIRMDEVRLMEAWRERVDQLRRLTSWTLVFGALFGILAAATFAIIGAGKSRNLVQANVRLRKEMAERSRAETELDRASRRNALILQAAGEGICGLDGEGRITFINPAAERMLGWAAEEAQGHRQHDLIHHTRPDGSEYPVDDCPIYASLRDGQVRMAREEFFWRKDGVGFPVEYIATPILEEDRIVGSVVTFRDITERLEVDRMKDEFVSVVSHELRTPLTSIRGSLGLLASGMLGSLPERGQRMLEIAAQNTDRLVRLINDILDIERIESGKVRMEPGLVKSEALVEEVVETVMGMAVKADVRIETTVQPVTFWADGDRFIQVLTNLLSNAVKFSPEGGVVELRCRREGSEVIFTVSDHGRGIPVDKQESIFGRFQQVDASDSREKGGTGLGLAIARSIVAQHEGRIWVESEPGMGSRFHVALPLSDSSVPIRPRPAPLVLLCDDDEITRTVVGERLRRGGYTVATVESGEEAVEAARTMLPDAILLDLDMPGMDGCETMVCLKDDAATSEIPIIIFSATREDSGAEALKHAAGWVTKDAAEGSLFETLERAVRRTDRIGRILLVEDDRDLAEVLIEIFERSGLTVVHAGSGQEAIERSLSPPPDLLVLDILLRDGDGFEVVDWLRSDGRLRTIPVVVYSALDLDDEQRERLRLGPTEFITKGRISPQDFERRVVRLLDELLKMGPEGR